MASSDRLSHRRLARLALALLLGGLAAACGGRDLSPEEEPDVAPRGPQREYGLEPSAGRLFGDDLSVNRLLSGDLFGRGDGRGSERGDGLPVNKYLWQATLDTLDFLPLISTDPFTGVIATDWAGSSASPNERLKVTAYLTRPELEASSLRVAVFRQVSDG